MNAGTPIGRRLAWEVVGLLWLAFFINYLDVKLHFFYLPRPPSRSELLQRTARPSWFRLYLDLCLELRPDGSNRRSFQTRPPYCR